MVIHVIKRLIQIIIITTGYSREKSHQNGWIAKAATVNRELGLVLYRTKESVMAPILS